MLVIAMKEGEVLKVGDNVSILVRQVKGGWVRLCIDAPREIVITRVQTAPAEETVRNPVTDVILRRRPAAQR
jgi:carbon storage regulator CsrA